MIRNSMLEVAALRVITTLKNTPKPIASSADHPPIMLNANGKSGPSQILKTDTITAITVSANGNAKPCMSPR